jgi:hypothetical protein
MYVVTVLVFLILPAGLAGFLLWRAYQLGIKRQTEFTHQWLSRPPMGIEQFALLFAWRDFVFALGLLSFLVLILLWPAYFAAWTSLLGLFGFVYMGFTGYALGKLKRAPRT